MKINQPSKNASSKIRMRVNQKWAEGLIIGIIRIYTKQYDTLCPDMGLILDFTVNELNRKGIYIIPKKKED